VLPFFASTSTVTPLRGSPLKIEVGDEHEAAFFARARVDGFFLRRLGVLVVGVGVGFARGRRIRVDRRRLLRVVLRVVALHLQQEQPAFQFAILREVLGQVDRLVVWLAALQARQRDLAFEAVRHVVGAEAADEVRVAEVALRLRDQVLQLRRLHTRQLDAQARQVAHQHRDLLLAAHRQQRALAQDAQLGRVGRHGDDALRVAAHQVTAKALRARIDLHIQHAAPSGPASMPSAPRR